MASELQMMGLRVGVTKAKARWEGVGAALAAVEKARELAWQNLRKAEGALQVAEDRNRLEGLGPEVRQALRSEFPARSLEDVLKVLWLAEEHFGVPPGVPSFQWSAVGERLHAIVLAEDASPRFRPTEADHAG